jgi:hypothetical protein
VLLEGNPGVRPVDASEEIRCSCIERGKDRVGREQLLPDLRAREEGPVGDDRHREVGYLLETPDHPPDAGVEEGLAGSHEGYPVDVAGGVFRKDGFGRSKDGP